eukprot:1882321-Ditylum_brightwellii.AAC.1
MKHAAESSFAFDYTLRLLNINSAPVWLTNSRTMVITRGMPVKKSKRGRSHTLQKRAQTSSNKNCQKLVNHQGKSEN